MTSAPKNLCTGELKWGNGEINLLPWQANHIGYKGWWPQAGLKTSAESGVGNWRQRAIICRMKVCSQLWLGGGCWVTLCRGRVCWVTVYTALGPAVPQQFNYTGLCLHFFFFPLPTFAPKSSNCLEAKHWILHHHHTASLHVSSALFTNESAAENCQTKELGLMLRSAFEMFSEHCVRHSTRSVKRHWGSRLFVSEGDFNEGN